MKFFIRTLGCKMNQLDSARVTAALRAAGHQPAEIEDEAEYVLVNSCTVTAQSDRKSRQAANTARRENKQVAVLGCGPRSSPERWRTTLPDTLLFDSQDALLAHFGADAGWPVYPVTSRTRLPVAIQTGCDDVCSFCITRIARGPHSSHPRDQVVRHVREAFDQGVREVVLTGINLAAWGCDDTRHPEQARLPELLEALLRDTEMPRIRLSSLGPQYLHDTFFDILRDPRICDHLHLSVQSGSLGVLARMRRGHDADDVDRASERARAVRPEVALTTDFIVGFPGESELEFQETLKMVERIGFAKLHVFPFSPREGTPAASLPGQIENTEKKRRGAVLRDVGRRMRGRFLASRMGDRGMVLVEHDGTGLTTNYIRLRVDGAREGTLRRVRISPKTVADRW